jgi:hypothetical protein
MWFNIYLTDFYSAVHRLVDCVLCRVVHLRVYLNITNVHLATDFEAHKTTSVSYIHT